MLGAEFLAELDGTGRAVFHASAAGHAVLGIHLGHIGAAAHVGSIEQLRGAQRVADLDVAVADGEDLALAVDVGNLMHKAMVFRLLEDGHRLVVGDVVAAAGLAEVVRHVANAYAPVAVVVRTALIQLLAAVAAGADAHADVAFVFLEPVGDVLDADRLVFHADGLLHGYHVHSYATAAHWHHRGDLLQREEGHPLEEHRELGMPVHQVGVHVGILGAAGHEHRHPVDAVFPVEGGAGIGALPVGVMVAVIVFEHAEVGQFVQQFIEAGIVRGEMLFSVQRVQLGVCPVLAHLEGAARQHGKKEVQRCFSGGGVHFVFEDAGEAPVLGSFGRHLDFAGNAVGDVADEFDKFRIGVLVAKMLGDELGGHFRHISVLFPITHFIQKPLGEFLNPFAGLGADGDDGGFGIAHMHILLAFCKVEIEVWHHVGLVHEHKVADREHKGIFEWLVVPFRHGQDHGIAATPGIELGRTDQVAHILQDYQIQAVQRHVVQALAGHFSIEMAHPSSMELDGFDAGGFLDLHGIHIGVDIRLHHRHAQFIFYQIQCAYESGGLAASGRRHQIKEEYSLVFQLFTEIVRIKVIVGEDALLDLYHLHLLVFGH